MDLRESIDTTIRREVAQPPMRMTKGELGRELAEAVRDHVADGITQGLHDALQRARGNVDFY